MDNTPLWVIILLLGPISLVIVFFISICVRSIRNYKGDKPSLVHWDGWECNKVESTVGHMNWAHKDGVLIILNSSGLVYIPKGESIEVDLFGNTVGKISPDLLDNNIIKSAQKLRA